MQAPRPHRLYVGGLNDDVTQEDLRKRFFTFGNLLSIDRVVGSSGKSKGFAYVEFEPGTDLTKCLRTLNGTKWHGKRLKIEAAKQSYREKLEQEWKEQRQEEEARQKAVEEALAAKEKKLSVWKRGKAARLLPVLTIRKPNGKLHVVDPSKNKDAVTILYDDDILVKPMGKWSWDSEPQPKKRKTAVDGPSEANDAQHEAEVEHEAEAEVAFSAAPAEASEELRSEAAKALNILEQVLENEVAGDNGGMELEEEEDEDGYEEELKVAPDPEPKLLPQESYPSEFDIDLLDGDEEATAADEAVPKPEVELEKAERKRSRGEAIDSDDVGQSEDASAKKRKKKRKQEDTAADGLAAEPLDALAATDSPEVLEAAEDDVAAVTAYSEPFEEPLYLEEK